MSSNKIAKNSSSYCCSTDAVTKRYFSCFSSNRSNQKTHETNKKEATKTKTTTTSNPLLNNTNNEALTRSSKLLLKKSFRNHEEEISKNMVEFYKNCYAKNVHVTDSLLRTQASQYAKQMEMKITHLSDEWLTNLKKNCAEVDRF